MYSHVFSHEIERMLNISTLSSVSEHVLQALEMFSDFFFVVLLLVGLMLVPTFGTCTMRCWFSLCTHIVFAIYQVWF
jgi:hypothetical protein